MTGMPVDHYDDMMLCTMIWCYVQSPFSVFTYMNCHVFGVFFPPTRRTQQTPLSRQWLQSPPLLIWDGWCSRQSTHLSLLHPDGPRVGVVAQHMRPAASAPRQVRTRQRPPAGKDRGARYANKTTISRTNNQLTNQLANQSIRLSTHAFTWLALFINNIQSVSV